MARLSMLAMRAFNGGESETTAKLQRLGLKLKSKRAKRWRRALSRFGRR
jgi:hypothetical protein